jgi:hypothetical protein
MYVLFADPGQEVTVEVLESTIYGLEVFLSYPIHTIRSPKHHSVISNICCPGIYVSVTSHDVISCCISHDFCCILKHVSALPYSGCTIYSFGIVILVLTMSTIILYRLFLSISAYSATPLLCCPTYLYTRCVFLCISACTSVQYTFCEMLLRTHIM